MNPSKSAAKKSELLTQFLIGLWVIIGIKIT